MATYDPFRDLDRLASSLLDTRRGPVSPRNQVSSRTSAEANASASTGA